MVSSSRTTMMMEIPLNDVKSGRLLPMT